MHMLLESPLVVLRFVSHTLFAAPVRLVSCGLSCPVSTAYCGAVSLRET